MGSRRRPALDVTSTLAGRVYTRFVLLFRQEFFKEGVQHSFLRIDCPDPLTELPPSLAVGILQMLPFNKGSLVQQRNSAPGVAPGIEFLQEMLPCQLVRIAVCVDR